MATKPTDMTEEEWEAVMLKAGFQRRKSGEYKRNMKKAFDNHWEEKSKKKPVIESRDIMEPLDTRIVKE